MKCALYIFNPGATGQVITCYDPLSNKKYRYSLKFFFFRYLTEIFVITIFSLNNLNSKLCSCAITFIIINNRDHRHSRIELKEVQW